MIHVEDLHYSVGTFALEGVRLDVAPGEYFVLLGPSGSGKTLLLECLSGLNRIDAGRITIAGEDVTLLEARHRGIGYLPQDYALFPHLSVRRNVAFGLHTATAPHLDLRTRVEEVMRMVGVERLADRMPRNLSGGEKQRAALARALAVRPQVLLLDEPVSAVDEQTRDSLCRQLRRLQRQTGTTTVHVCHNFAEMLAVADRVAVIHQGRILQSGPPHEVVERPLTETVARFVQAENIFKARAVADGPWMKLICPGGAEFRTPRGDRTAPESDVTFIVRPENVQVADGTAPLPPDAATLYGTVRSVADLGPLVRLAVDCGRGLEMAVSLGKKEYREHACTPGEHVRLAVRPEDVHVLQ